ncbi:MAG: Transcriptional regulator, PadR family, partial [uncultured Rubrobacteraceae bacterium]
AAGRGEERRGFGAFGIAFGDAARRLSGGGQVADGLSAPDPAPRPREASVRQQPYRADKGALGRRDERVAEHRLSAAQAARGEGVRSRGVGAAGDEEPALLHDNAGRRGEVLRDKGEHGGAPPQGKEGYRMPARGDLRPKGERM